MLRFPTPVPFSFVVFIVAGTLCAAAQRPSTPLDALLQQLRPFSDYRDPRYDLEHCLSTLSDYVESASDLSAYDRVRVWNTMGMLAFDHAPTDSRDHDRALAYHRAAVEAAGGKLSEQVLLSLSRLTYAKDPQAWLRNEMRYHLQLAGWSLHTDEELGALLLVPPGADLDDALRRFRKRLDTMRKSFAYAVVAAARGPADAEWVEMCYGPGVDLATMVHAWRRTHAPTPAAPPTPVSAGKQAILDLLRCFEEAVHVPPTREHLLLLGEHLYDDDTLQAIEHEGESLSVSVAEYAAWYLEWFVTGRRPAPILRQPDRTAVTRTWRAWWEANEGRTLEEIADDRVGAALEALRTHGVDDAAVLTLRRWVGWDFDVRGRVALLGEDPAKIADEIEGWWQASKQLDVPARHPAAQALIQQPHSAARRATIETLAQAEQDSNMRHLEAEGRQRRQLYDAMRHLHPEALAELEAILATQPATLETARQLEAWLDTYGPLLAETEFAPEIDRLKAEVDRNLRRESGP